MISVLEMVNSVLDPIFGVFRNLEMIEMKLDINSHERSASIVRNSDWQDEPAYRSIPSFRREVIRDFPLPV